MFVCGCSLCSHAFSSSFTAAYVSNSLIRREDSPSSQAVPAVASVLTSSAADGAVVATRDSGDDVYVHGKSADGRDSIVMCDVGDEKDELFEEGMGTSVLDITADDGDV